MSLSGKVAVVAGSTRGIGRGIALQFAQANASLVLLYNSDATKAKQVCLP
jgi:NAD(P)-dependent dehydrogenase (short-subunit alcohol dehydrogenase family)